MASKIYPVKWIDSTMRGAPRLSGTAGDLITVLDAFLLTGWGAITPTSITVASGIATVVTNVGESFAQDAVVLVSGATPAALNGEQRVLSSTSTGFTFATSAVDGSATGTISIKYAPQGGWEKAFTGTNKAVYRSTDVYGSRFFYRIDDTGTTSARVRGFIAMSDIDTGTGLFPKDAQLSGGVNIIKSNAANTTPAPYLMVADARFVETFIAALVPTNPSYIARLCSGFGDPVALAAAGDPWCAVVAASTVSTVTAENAVNSLVSPHIAGSPTGTYFAASADASVQSVAAGARAYVGNGYSGSSDFFGPVTAAPIEGAYVSRQFFADAYANGAALTPPRADVPGVIYIGHTGAAAVFEPLSRIDVDLGADTRRCLPVRTPAATSIFSSAYGCTLVDITGPWRLA